MSSSPWQVHHSAARGSFGLRRLKALTAVGLLLLLSACASSSVAGVRPGGDWPSFTMNNSDTRDQAGSTITRRNVAKLHQSWMIATGQSVTSTPVVLNGNVYFADWGGDVYSARVASGKVNWKVNLGNAISSTLTLSAGKVYVALSADDTALVPPDNGNRVVALSQSTGRVLWQAKLPSTAQGIWGSPTVFDGMIFIGAAGGWGQQESIPPFVGGTLWALDAATGKIVWTKTLNGTAGGGGLWGSVTVSPSLDAIYFGTANSYAPTGTINDSYSIVSLNAKTGRQNWRFQAYPNEVAGDDNDFGATPNLFSFTFGGRVRSAVGIGSKDGHYYVVDALTGKLIEKIMLKSQGGVIGDAAVDPTGDNPEVFVPLYANSLDVADPRVCCGALVSLNPSHGRVAWYVTVDANVIGSVALVPGAVFFGDAKGNVYGLSTAAGGPTLFHVQLPDAIEAGVTPAEGHLFVATTQGDPAPYATDDSMPVSGLGLYAFTP